ncbi:hypothetical protein BJY00DRAFT_18931 [Aspergillus carlsbadensis]|nr:hypothetical protein BJY00DRAFT_18931 [Aspergillus carlsbadensis]
MSLVGLFWHRDFFSRFPSGLVCARAGWAGWARVRGSALVAVSVGAVAGGRAWPRRRVRMASGSVWGNTNGRRPLVSAWIWGSDSEDGCRVGGGGQCELRSPFDQKRRTTDQIRHSPGLLPRPRTMCPRRLTEAFPRLQAVV